MATERRCFNCDLPAKFHDYGISRCGERKECEDEFTKAVEEQRQDAHEAVDRDFGYERF